MATVRGEGVRVELLTDGGWRDISDSMTSVEIGPLDSADMAVADWFGDDVTITVHVGNWKEVVETSSGKAIAVKPRTEM